ncbi:NTP transferase domain-containing protein [Paraeggerthella sp.]|uniref:NTP transferase domain-containing protein n=1 Tax=Paraeggerthella sp. TaxID=2897350 RepID=UPI003529A53F
MEAAAIVLAAGAGTRMKSKKPKVAHEVLGKPLVRWVVDAAREAGVDRVVSVVGHAREQVIPLIEGDTQAVVQSEQNGTAGAVLVCADALADFDGSLVVLSGDCPLITSRTIAQLVEARERDNAAVVVLTMELDDPFGYGRIVRDERGSVARIVEQKDATPEEAALRECNSGFYCFDARALFDALAQVGNDNAQGEFYLTDVLEICRRAGRPVLALPCDDASECLGRELACTAGRGHEAAAASHQRWSHGEWRDHDRSRPGVDRAGRGYRAGCRAAAPDVFDGVHAHRRRQRGRAAFPPDRHGGGPRLHG